MKNSLVPIAVISIAVAVYLIFNSAQTVKNIRQTLDLERYQRITAEEKLQQAETRVRILESRLNDSETKFDQIHAILEEKEAVASDVAVGSAGEVGQAQDPTKAQDENPSVDVNQ